MGAGEVANVNPPCYSAPVTSRFAYGGIKKSDEPFIGSRGKFKLVITMFKALREAVTITVTP